MSQPELVFISAGPDGSAELVVNFGVYSGRQATPAEVERLARALLQDVAAVEIVCEQRYEFTLDAEATVFRVRVLVPGAGQRAGELRDAVAAWAEDCIEERHVALGGLGGRCCRRPPTDPASAVLRSRPRPSRRDDRPRRGGRSSSASGQR